MVSGDWPSIQLPHRHPLVIVEPDPGGDVLLRSGGAAASLLDVGFTDVGDLVGGVRAWIDAGLSVLDPDHSHLDI